MAEPFATLDDVEILFRTLSVDEQTRVDALLPVISDELRYRAFMVGRDLDAMIVLLPGLENVAKEVTVAAISRILRQNTTSEPMTQESQAGLGYSWSGTYAIPGGANLPVMRNDLKRLGITKQRWGALDIYGTDNWD